MQIGIGMQNKILEAMSMGLPVITTTLANNAIGAAHGKEIWIANTPEKVAEAISRVKLTEYWSPIMTKYNTAMNLTGGEKINPDLNAYVTQKAIEGLFKMVEQEENKIRKDPAARVTELLAKVFGSL